MRSILLRSSTLRCGTATRPSRSEPASASIPRLASISTPTMSASCAPAQAVDTMARSGRRRGATIPGVSMNTSCASPSMAMPRRSARVVCTLCDTIVTLVPTNALISVDLPALGAPISATKPQRWSSAAIVGSAITAVRLDAFLRQHGGGGGLLGRALRAPDAFRCGVAGQLDRDAELRAVVGPLALDLAVGGRRQPAPLRPFLQNGLGVAQRPHRRAHALLPEAPDQGRCRLVAAVHIDRADQGLAHIGQDGDAVAPTRVALGSAKPDRLAKPDQARDIGAGFLAHQVGEPTGQLAFVRARKVTEQHVRDDQPQHVVTQEFKPLVARPAALARPCER